MPPSPKPTPDRPYLWEWDPLRYGRSYLFGKIREDRVQADIVSALALLGIHASVVDVGGAAMRGKFYGAMVRAGIAECMARAVLKGVSGVSAGEPGHSDLHGVLAPDGRAFFIEVKAPAWINPQTGGTIQRQGEPSEEQLSFLDAKAAAGAIVGVAWNVADALDILGQARIEAHRRSRR